MVYWISSKLQRKFLRFCFIYIQSAAIAQSIRRKNFRNSSKICKSCEAFSHVYIAFVVYMVLTKANEQVPYIYTFMQLANQLIKLLTWWRRILQYVQVSSFLH